jgi:type II secretory pathway pseudopilin PulG
VSHLADSTVKATLGRRLRAQGGYSLPELLVAMSLMIVVLGATLAPFEYFQRGARRNGDQNQAEDTARLTMGNLVREGRNVAGQSQFVEKATATDLVFQTVDGSTSPAGTNAANIERLRYCLNTTTNVLWRQSQTWTTNAPPALPSTSSCPDSGWPAQRQAASNVVNYRGGATRPVFTYCNSDNTTCSSSPSSLTDITFIRLTPFVDVNGATSAPAESELTSSVYLRNQNKPPTASFTASAIGDANVQLNGSNSSDPEGGTLSYKWLDGSTFAGATQIGTGQSCTCTALGTGSRTIWLQVTDPTGLTATASQAVTLQ